MYKLDEGLKTVRGEYIIINFTHYVDDGRDYILYLHNEYVGFVRKEETKVIKGDI